MLVRISTARIGGSGYLDCKKCDHRIVLNGPGIHLIILDFGTVQTVRSANTLAFLHRCGDRFEWVCPDCGYEFDPEGLRRIGHDGRVQCACGARINQRRVVPSPL